MPNGNFILDDAPWTSAMQRFIDVAKPRGIPVCKQRSRAGTRWAGEFGESVVARCGEDGKLTSIANAVVREITVDKNTGLPNGCNFVDRLSQREMSVKARVVVLAAGTLESTRLLAEFEPCELERAGGALPDGPGLRPWRGCLGSGGARNGNINAVMGSSAIVPRFRNIETKSDKFLRGYAFNTTAATGRWRRATLRLTVPSCSASWTSTTAADST